MNITFIATQWLMGWVLFRKCRSDLGIDKIVNMKIFLATFFSQQKRDVVKILFWFKLNYCQIR